MSTLSSHSAKKNPESFLITLLSYPTFNSSRKPFGSTFKTDLELNYFL